MITFEVKDMTCGHCVGTITQALHAMDRDAEVRVDLEAHHVHVTSARSDATRIGDALRSAGYTPERIETSAPYEAETSAPKRGCCCG